MADDRQLVRAVLAREPGAFTLLVERYQRLVWHLVYRMVAHTEETRDLSQEVFLRVYRQLPQFRFDAALSSWIGRIAWSVAVRHLGKKRLPLVDLEPRDAEESSPVREIADGVDLEAELIRGETERRLGEAVAALPPVQRTAVTLYHVEELGIAEISEITGLPAGTIKSHLFRARRALRDRLAGEIGGSG